MVKNPHDYNSDFHDVHTIFNRRGYGGMGY